MLLKVYEYCLWIMPDYITKSGDLNFKSLKIFVEEMTFYEQDIIGEIINKESQAKNRDQMNKSKSDSEVKT
jgi:5'-3' exonuclease